MATYRQLSSALLQTQAQVLVVPVNCAGVMGSGLAKELAQQYPDLYFAYKIACQLQVLRPGHCWSYVLDPDFGTHSVVMCLPVKDHYTDPIDPHDVRSGLGAAARQLSATDLGTMAVPLSGAGLVGMDWLQMRDLAITELKDLDVLVELYS